MNAGADWESRIADACRQGEAAYGEDRFHDAEAAFREARELAREAGYPPDPAVGAALARCLLAARDFDAAIAALREAVRAWEEADNALEVWFVRVDLAAAYWLSGRGAEAGRVWRTAAERVPAGVPDSDRSLLLQNLGAVAIALSDQARLDGDPAAAIRWHEETMRVETELDVRIDEPGGLHYPGTIDRSVWPDPAVGESLEEEQARRNRSRGSVGEFASRAARPFLLLVPPAPGIFGPLFPRGAATIASFLEDRGIPCSVVPLSHYVDVSAGDALVEARIREVTADAVASLTPRAIGVSIPYTYLWPRGAEIARAARAAAPGTPILVGGPHVSYLDRVCLSEVPEIDVVVRGEGEWTALELLTALEDGRALDSVAGITWRGEDGEIRRNPPRSLGDLSELPPVDFGLLPRRFAEQMEVHGIASRGCAWRCRYCHEYRYWGRTVRRYPADRVVGELTRLAEDYGNPMAGIDDSMLDMRDPSFGELMAGLRESGRVPERFGLVTRADTITRDGLDAMRSAGIRWMSVGLESGSEKVLAAMNKRLTVPRLIEGLEVARDSGARVATFVIVGHPGDNPVESEKTRVLVDRMFREGLAGWLDLATFTPYPGTPFFSRPERHGVRILTWDWTRWRRTNRPVAELTDFSAGEIYLELLRLLEVQAGHVGREPAPR